jgi:hypothetical protein
MADIPPPLSAKEFFTPEFLRDPYPTYRRYLDGPGLLKPYWCQMRQ